MRGSRAAQLLCSGPAQAHLTCGVGATGRPQLAPLALSPPRFCTASCRRPILLLLNSAKTATAAVTALWVQQTGQVGLESPRKELLM